MHNISFVADVTHGNTNYLADVSVQEDCLKFVVSSPENIKGLTLTVSANGTTAEFLGISYPIDMSAQPHGAIVQVLYNILNDVTTRQMNFSEDNCEIKGMAENYNYTFIFSPSGLPISLRVDEIDLFIKFTNVTLN